MTSLTWSPPGSTRSKPGLHTTLTTVCAVLTVYIVGSTHAAFLCVTLKGASCVGMSCLRILKTASERRKSCGEVKPISPRLKDRATRAVQDGTSRAEKSTGLERPTAYLNWNRQSRLRP